MRAANAEDNVAGCGSYGLGSIRGDLGGGSFVTGLGSIRGRLGSGAVGDNRGGRIRNNGSFAAAGDDFNIGCIVLAEEIYGEVVGVTCFEFVIIRTAAEVALSGSDPDTVTGSRVRNAPVIGACGYFDGDGVVDNDVARCGAAVCIYGNLILECIVQTCGCVAALGERTFCGDLIAECGCICIEEHLITGTVAPNIANGEADGSGGCAGITIPCLDGQVGVNGCTVVVPTREYVTLMLGRCGEVGFIKDGACFNGVAAGDGFVGETVNEDYIVFGNFDGSNGHVVLGVKNGYFCAGADGAAKGCCAGCGIDNEELTFVGFNLGVLCPEELVGVVIPNSGLNVLKTMACSADRGAIAVGEVDGVENSIVCFVAETVCIAAAVDCKGHDGVRTCIENSNFGKRTGCKVYGVDGTTVCIVFCDSVHFAFCMVVCHSNNNAACAGAGVCNLVGVSVHDVEAGVVGVAVIHEAVYIAACECAAEGGAHCAEVFDNAGIIISETAPDAGSAFGIECDVAFKVYSGQRLGYGNGCGTGNGGICNGGYGNGGGAFRNADNNAVFVNGCDCGVCNAEGNVLVECLCGENRVSNGCPAAGGNCYVFNFDGGGNYGCADVYIVNVCIVAFLINGAVLLVGPGDGVFTCGELNCIGGPGFNAVPLCNFGTVNEELEAIPNGVAEAFAERHKVELEDVTCCRGNRGGNRGGGVCDVDVGALCSIAVYDPRIVAFRSEGEGSACNVESLIEVRSVCGCCSGTGLGRGAKTRIVRRRGLCHDRNGNQREYHHDCHKHCEEFLHA